MKPRVKPSIITEAENYVKTDALNPISWRQPEAVRIIGGLLEALRASYYYREGQEALPPGTLTSKFAPR